MKILTKIIQCKVLKTIALRYAYSILTRDYQMIVVIKFLMFSMTIFIPRSVCYRNMMSKKMGKPLPNILFLEKIWTNNSNS